MAAIPKYAQELVTEVKIHAAELGRLDRDRTELWRKQDGTSEAIAELRASIAVMDHKLEQHDQLLKKWENRWWYLVGGFIVGLLALVGNLILQTLKH